MKKRFKYALHFVLHPKNFVPVGISLETETKQSLELSCTEHLGCRNLTEIGRVHIQVGIPEKRFVQHVVGVYSQLKAFRFHTRLRVRCSHRHSRYQRASTTVVETNRFMLPPVDGLRSVPRRYTR